MFKSLWFILVLIFCGLPGRIIGQDQAVSQELVQYIRDAKKAGLKEPEIEQNAVKAGWSAAAVKAAIDLHRPPANPGIPSAVEAPATAPVEKGKAVTPPAAPVETPQAAPLSRPADAPANAAGNPPAAAADGTPAEGDGAARAKQRNVSDEYRIGDGDVIQVSVWGERDASVGGIVVRPDGMITMPLIKDVKVSGLTPAEAEKEISGLLVKLNVIKVPDVTVIVNQTNSKKVFMVGGGIKKEGPIPYTYRMTVMQAISEAGGLTDYAKRKKIYILRTENGRQFQLPFDYDAVLKGQRMELNITLLAGDTLVVPNR